MSKAEKWEGKKKKKQQCPILYGALSSLEDKGYLNAQAY